MSAEEIIAELSKLDRTDLECVHAQLHAVLAAGNIDLKSQKAEKEPDKRLVQAAEALLPDYSADSALTAFTTLDSEPFHAQG